MIRFRGSSGAVWTALVAAVLLTGCGTGEYEERMQTALHPPPPPPAKPAAPAGDAAANPMDPMANAANPMGAAAAPVNPMANPMPAPAVMP